MKRLSKWLPAPLLLVLWWAGAYVLLRTQTMQRVEWVCWLMTALAALVLWRVGAGLAALDARLMEQHRQRNEEAERWLKSVGYEPSDAPLGPDDDRSVAETPWRPGATLKRAPLGGMALILCFATLLLGVPVLMGLTAHYGSKSPESVFERDRYDYHGNIYLYLRNDEHGMSAIADCHIWHDDDGRPRVSVVRVRKRQGPESQWQDATTLVPSGRGHSQLTLSGETGVYRFGLIVGRNRKFILELLLAACLIFGVSAPIWCPFLLKRAKARRNALWK